MASNNIITSYDRVDVSRLIPYANNAKKHPDKQIDKLCESIKEFGFLSPIIIDKDYNIIAGHGRILAAKKLNLETVPAVFVEGLTDEQRRAYILADNRLTEMGGWDYKAVKLELADLSMLDVNLDLTGFNADDLLPSIDSYYGDERERTYKTYNLDLALDSDLTPDFWQMPKLQPESYIPEMLLGFKYAMRSKDTNFGIHFYLDDYQFERVWNRPDDYINLLLKFECILSPDFSLYLDMPTPMKIWNVYRSRQLGAFYQSKGIKVIPTLQWAEKDSFQYCFEGIPENSVVSVSTVGVKEEGKAVFKAGMDEAIKRLKPSMVLEYGGDIGYEYTVPVKRYKNLNTEVWTKRKKEIKANGK